MEVVLSEFMENISEKYYESLKAKGHWGRHEAYKLYQEALSGAMIEVLTKGDFIFICFA